MAEKGGLSGLILEGSRFEGKLTFKNMMRIEGEFVGEMVSESQLQVGKAAKVNADIRVRELIVMGEVQGTISDCDRLEIQAGGRVMADIKVKTLDIKPGAIFDGKCSMIVKDQSKPRGENK